MSKIYRGNGADVKIKMLKDEFKFVTESGSKGNLIWLGLSL